MLTPSIALSVRHLHDRNLSGWWFLLAFIPYAGAIALIVVSAFPGARGENRFGLDPLAREAA